MRSIKELVNSVLNMPRITCCPASVLPTMFLTGILLGATSSNAPAADSGPPDALQQARALSRQSFRQESRAKVGESFATFRRLLPVLAAANEAAGGASEDITFRRVVKEAGAHSERFDELVAAYGQWTGSGNIRPRITRPRELGAIHLTEAYRPAWEALLLAPPSAEIEFMQRRFTITQALFKIGNPESLPVLELAFASTCEEGVNAVDGSAAAERRFRILETLNRFATRESLQTMLRCLRQAEASSAGQTPRHGGRDLHEWVERFLTDQDNYQTREKWSQVLSSFPKDNLSAKERELLDRAARRQ